MKRKAISHVDYPPECSHMYMCQSRNGAVNQLRVIDGVNVLDMQSEHLYIVDYKKDAPNINTIVLAMRLLFGELPK